MPSPIVGLAVLMMVVIIILVMSGIRVIQPYEEGLWIVLGNYKKKLRPGFHFVHPLISAVIKVDMRSLSLDLPSQEFVFGDDHIITLRPIVTLRVIDSQKAYFEVNNYKSGVLSLTQSILNSILTEINFREFKKNQDELEAQIISALNQECKVWGVKIEKIKLGQFQLIGWGKKSKTEIENRKISLRLRDLMNNQTEQFGVRVEVIEFQ